MQYVTYFERITNVLITCYKGVNYIGELSKLVPTSYSIKMKIFILKDL